MQTRKPNLTTRKPNLITRKPNLTTRNLILLKQEILPSINKKSYSLSNMPTPFHSEQERKPLKFEPIKRQQNMFRGCFPT